MQFKRVGKTLSSTGMLDDYLYEVKDVQGLCKVLNNTDLIKKLKTQDRTFIGALTNYFKEIGMIYKHNHKYHVKGENEDLSMFFQKSRNRLEKERKESQSYKTNGTIPPYTQYDKAYHEDYVYSDANWHPSLAHL